MTGVDTNVLARLLLADDEDQTRAAQRLADSATQGAGLFISAFALLELAWLLKAKKFRQEEIAGALERLVSADGVRVSNRTAVLEALGRFRQVPAVCFRQACVA